MSTKTLQPSPSQPHQLGVPGQQQHRNGNGHHSQQHSHRSPSHQMTPPHPRHQQAYAHMYDSSPDASMEILQYQLPIDGQQPGHHMRTQSQAISHQARPQHSSLPQSSRAPNAYDHPMFQPTEQPQAQWNHAHMQSPSSNALSPYSQAATPYSHNGGHPPLHSPPSHHAHFLTMHPESSALQSAAAAAHQAKLVAEMELASQKQQHARVIEELEKQKAEQQHARMIEELEKQKAEHREREQALTKEKHALEHERQLHQAKLAAQQAAILQQQQQQQQQQQLLAQLEKQRLQADMHKQLHQQKLALQAEALSTQKQAALQQVQLEQQRQQAALQQQIQTQELTNQLELQRQQMELEQQQKAAAEELRLTVAGGSPVNLLHPASLTPPVMLLHHPSSLSQPSVRSSPLSSYRGGSLQPSPSHFTTSSRNPASAARFFSPHPAVGHLNLTGLLVPTPGPVPNGLFEQALQAQLDQQKQFHFQSPASNNTSNVSSNSPTPEHAMQQSRSSGSVQQQMDDSYSTWELNNVAASPTAVQRHAPPPAVFIPPSTAESPLVISTSFSALADRQRGETFEIHAQQLNDAHTMHNKLQADAHNMHAQQLAQQQKQIEELEKKLLEQNQERERMLQVKAELRLPSPAHPALTSTPIRPPNIQSAPLSASPLPRASITAAAALPANVDAVTKLTALLLQQVLSPSNLASNANFTPMHQAALLASGSPLPALSERGLKKVAKQDGSGKGAASKKKKTVAWGAAIESSKPGGQSHPSVPLAALLGDLDTRSFSADLVLAHTRSEAAMSKHVARAAKRQLEEAARVAAIEAEEKAERARRDAEFQKRLLAQRRAKARLEAREESTRADELTGELRVVEDMADRARRREKKLQGGREREVDRLERERDEARAEAHAAKLKAAHAMSSNTNLHGPGFQLHPHVVSQNPYLDALIAPPAAPVVKAASHRFPPVVRGRGRSVERSRSRSRKAEDDVDNAAGHHRTSRGRSRSSKYTSADGPSHFMKFSRKSLLGTFSAFETEEELLKRQQGSQKKKKPAPSSSPSRKKRPDGPNIRTVSTKDVRGHAPNRFAARGGASSHSNASAASTPTSEDDEYANETFEPLAAPAPSFPIVVQALSNGQTGIDWQSGAGAIALKQATSFLHAERERERMEKVQAHIAATGGDILHSHPVHLTMEQEHERSAMKKLRPQHESRAQASLSRHHRSASAEPISDEHRSSSRRQRRDSRHGGSRSQSVLSTKHTPSVTFSTQSGRFARIDDADDQPRSPRGKRIRGPLPPPPLKPTLSSLKKTSKKPIEKYRDRRESIQAKVASVKSPMNKSPKSKMAVSGNGDTSSVSTSLLASPAPRTALSFESPSAAASPPLGSTSPFAAHHQILRQQSTEHRVVREDGTEEITTTTTVVAVKRSGITPTQGPAPAPSARMTSLTEAFLTSPPVELPHEPVTVPQQAPVPHPILSTVHPHPAPMEVPPTAAFSVSEQPQPVLESPQLTPVSTSAVSESDVHHELTASEQARLDDEADRIAAENEVRRRDEAAAAKFAAENAAASMASVAPVAPISVRLTEIQPPTSADEYTPIDSGDFEPLDRQEDSKPEEQEPEPEEVNTPVSGGSSPAPRTPSDVHAATSPNDARPAVKSREKLWTASKAPPERKKSVLVRQKLWDAHATTATVSQVLKDPNMTEDDRRRFLEDLATAKKRSTPEGISPAFAAVQARHSRHPSRESDQSKSREASAKRSNIVVGVGISLASSPSGSPAMSAASSPLAKYDRLRSTSRIPMADSTPSQGPAIPPRHPATTGSPNIRASAIPSGIPLRPASPNKLPRSAKRLQASPEHASAASCKYAVDEKQPSYSMSPISLSASSSKYAIEEKQQFLSEEVAPILSTPIQPSPAAATDAEEDDEYAEDAFDE
jgi:hypothetical protein